MLASSVLRRVARAPSQVIKFVPQQEAWIIERFGKFNRILEPGLAILIPVIDDIKYVQSLKEVAIEIPSQSAITLDNVTLHLDGVLYLRVIEPYKASYGVEEPEFAVTQLAQTTMRSELGKISLDNIFQERERLNHNIVEAINHAAEVWGIRCLRYEIRDIQLPSSVVEAMQMQVEAERKKRAAVLQSEGQREAAINVAEGRKQSQILASEARKMEQINIATGEANAIVAKATARAQGIEKVSLALQQQFGERAATLNVAELYVSAFSNLAKTNNTVLLPANVGDAGSMVAQAMAVYGQVTGRPKDDPHPLPVVYQILQMIQSQAVTIRIRVVTGNEERQTVCFLVKSFSGSGGFKRLEPASAIQVTLHCCYVTYTDT
ncbi:Stomatin-like protein 2, mitochondrial [Desmophyllum pertusum]|uniref:Stomatin-like protein 2, mitochondrial n=1 Tax=Desmophyllum pertusum TaxID=174260 RepID=A0A9X0CMU7_9CNID|nr:Stomatin-like protein 2, mitochondrial [Desmophyllum pertusum]